MKQCQTFEDLQDLGTEKIHEKTHISRDKLELVLTKSYSQIGKVQFMGYLSILEREYGIDLNDIRREYTDYWHEHAATMPPKHSVILQAPSRAKQKWLAAAAVTIVVLIGGGYYLQNFLTSAPSEEVMRLSSQAVEVLNLEEDANQSLAADINATSSTEGNIGDANLSESETAGSMAVSGSFTIRPKYKVWVGVIDLSAGTKTQQITSDPVVLDGTKKWLIVLGHGMVEIESAGQKQTLKESNTVWMSIEEGRYKLLSKSEFTQLNGGKNW